MHKFRLYKRPKGKKKNWLITWKDAQGKNKEFSTGTEDELIATNIFNAFKKGHAPLETISCGEIIGKYCYDLHKRQATLQSQKKTLSHEKILLKYFENANPYDLEEAIDNFTTQRQIEGISQNGIARDLSVLKASLNWAVSKKSGRLLKQMPYNVEVEKEDNPRLRWLENFEEELLLNALKDEPLYVKLTFGLALTTAQRLGAILDLKKGGVRFESNKIDFNYGKPKGKLKGRSICEIQDFIAKELKEAYLSSQSGYIIEKNGKPVTNFYNDFLRVRNKSGIEDFTFHDLRTTWSSRALQNGVPMIEISYQLAHSSIKITEKHYAKLPQATRHNATAFTDSFYKGKSL
tara:strand:+ start:3516 stop:4559 length:1044 start_codon:yes stop_codon:yes gene_type:complete